MAEDDIIIDESKRKARGVKELEYLLDEFIKTSKRDMYKKEVKEKAGLQILDAELKVCVYKKRAKKRDQIYGDIVFGEAYNRDPLYDKEAIYEMKMKMPIQRISTEPPVEMRNFLDEWKKRQPSAASYWIKKLDSYELFEYRSKKKLVDTWLFHPKSSYNVLIVMWDQEGYYDPFMIRYQDIDFPRVGDRLKLIHEEVGGTEELLNKLVEEGYLSREALNIIWDKIGGMGNDEDEDQIFNEQWYETNLKSLFESFRRMEGHIDLNYRMWEKAMEHGFRLLKLSGPADMSTYFIKPKDFPFYLMFFGDIYGFLPNYYISITEEKFSDYISERSNLILEVVLER